MAKITKRQDKIFTALTVLFHELIMAKHENKRDKYEEILQLIHEVTAPKEA